MDKTAQRTEIRLPGGRLTALKDDRFIRARGIKYATASRFQKPQPLTSWDEPQDCTQPAPICPQNPSRLGLVNGDLEKGRAQDEDCLTVTVIAPVSSRNAPVMVFIHGGAWVSGAGDLDAYSPHQLVEHGVVAVTVTHRLGVFGYLSIPDVASSPNLGLLDQIEALRWVKRNISAFGGDASNVTVFGQSAGADSVYCLAVADVAEDQPLFHRGILQSFPAALREDENRDEMTKAMSQHARQTVTPENASSISVSALLDLQKELLGVARGVSPALLAFGPVMGEDPLPAAEEALDRFVAACRTRQMMFGWTSNEDTAFTQIDKRPEAMTYLRNLFQGSTEQVVEKVAADDGQTMPLTYEISWHPEESDNLRATHCIDLPLLLGDWAAWKDAPMLQGQGVQEQVERLGGQMKSLWTAFAKGDVKSGTERFKIDKDFTFAS